MTCSLIKTFTQFYDTGCESCNFLQMVDNRQRVAECTSAYFEGMIAMMQPKESWVAKWQRIVRLIPGIYGIRLSRWRKPNDFLGAGKALASVGIDEPVILFLDKFDSFCNLEYVGVNTELRLGRDDVSTLEADAAEIENVEVSNDEAKLDGNSPAGLLGDVSCSRGRKKDLDGLLILFGVAIDS
ncbi:hypothetical protein PsorP6_002887 [Peronosclerospora sorghi]|uniref:Uncharacterized protein n=1 Tax=Peronosclerospora sorghi TaxID=230839 RepID=A0ACC0VQB9_9STRA|nr:hypothetical protein PsorP6_002887 [Peronosclerospora sorghi]